VVVVSKDVEQCRQWAGNLVTFYKNNDRVDVDGGGTRQASTKPSESACTPATR
jgi:hypothetical protein